MESVRIDRWLWAARFFKTRSLAKAAIDGGKVHLNGQRTKPAKEIQIGHELKIRRGDIEQVIIIEQLSDKRGPASIAQTLYRETEDSIETRESLRAHNRMLRAGLTIPREKPDKKARRELRRLKAMDDERHE